MAAATALALSPLAAAAHGPTLTHDPAIVRADRVLTAPPPGHGRVRLVTHGGTTALLSLDQFWRYQRAYDRALARAAFRMPVHRAEAHARRAAWHAVVGPAPKEASGAIRLKLIDR